MYEAVFEGRDIYLPSSVILGVAVRKEKPILTILNSSNTTVYYLQTMSVKLTKSDGKTPIPNEEVQLRFEDLVPAENATATLTTNSQGIAHWYVNSGKTTVPYGTHNNVRFVFHEVDTKDKVHSEYTNAESNYQTYILKECETKSLQIVDYDLGTTTAQTQAWYKHTGARYQCGCTCNDTDIDYTCDNSKTIKVNCKPDVLRVYFNQNNIFKILKATLTFNMQSAASSCQGANLGGYFENAPTIRLSSNRTDFIAGKGAQGFDVSTSGNTYYSQHNIKQQKIIWQKFYQYPTPATKDTNKYAVVTFDYGKNTGVQGGCIKINSINLQIWYTPKQSIESD